MKYIKVILPLVCLGLIALALILPAKVLAAGPYYWVGGSGNWSDATNHWSTSSGGAPNGANTPTSTDNVIFDAASAGAGFTVTVDTTANCADFDASTIDDAMILAGSSALNIYGSLTLSGTMGTPTYSGTITFKATAGTKTITSASKILLGSVVFDGVGGTFQLADAFNITGNLTLTNGTFDANTKTVTLSGGNQDITGAFTGGSSFANLTLTNVAKNDYKRLFSSIAVTGTFTATGAATTNRLMIMSNTTTQRTITAAVVSSAHVDYMYITGAGAGDWDLSSAGEDSIGYGNTTGITFTFPYNANENIYWTGLQDGAAGSGTWDSGSGGFNANDYNWSTTSGGVAGSARHYIPLSTNNAIFDANSGFTVGNSTVSVGSFVTCKDMTWTGSGAVVAPTLSQSGAASGATMTISGSLTLITGMTVTGTATDGFVVWTMAGTGTITDAAVAIAGYKFSVTGTYTLSDDLYLNGQSGTISFVNSGSLNTNSKTIHLATVGRFDGNGQTYYGLTLTGAGVYNITGANTFTNLTRTGTNTFTDGLTFAADQVVSGILTLTGYDISHRLQFGSSSVGTQRQITLNGADPGATVNNVDISDSAAVGSASKDISAGMNSDFGDNLGWIFTTPQNNYWVGNSGNWSDPTHWASTTGGAGGTGRIPLVQDTAFFDANSFSIPGRTVTIDITNLSGIDTSTVTNNPTLSKAGQVDIYGHINFGTCTWTVTSTYFKGHNTIAITGSGSYVFTSNVYINTSAPYMTAVNFNSAFNIVGSLNLLSGTVSLQGFNVTATIFDSTTTTYSRALNLSTGTLTLNGTAAGTKFGVAALNLNVYQGTSTIIMTNSGANGQTFAGAGFTYYNLTIQGAGNYTTTFTGNNIANNLTIDRSAAAKSIAGNVTWTVTQLYIPVNGVVVVSIANTDFSKASGTVVTDYLSFTSGNNTCTAGGGATFYAGVHSIGSPQTGWNFSDPAAPTITTVAASAIALTSAALNANLTNLGGYGTIYVYYHYGTDPALVSYSASAPMASYLAPSTDSKVVTGLAGETTYYFKAVASDGVSDLATGAIMSFITLGAPTVSTLSAVAITQYAATLQGQITSMGNYATVFGYFDWGTTISYGTTTAHQTESAITAFSQALTGLSPNTIYHFRANLVYGSNIVVNGLDGTFTTLSLSGGVPTPPLGYTVPTPNQPSNWWAGGANIPNLPLYGMFLNTSNSTGIPVQTLYMFVILGFGIILAVTTIVQTHTIFLGMLVLFVIMAMGSAATVIPGWMILTYILLSVGVVFVWRQQ